VTVSVCPVGPRRTIIGIASFIALLAGSAVAAAPTPVAQDNPRHHGSTTVAPATSDGVTVLFLGDSLALCGFGKRLDAHFRETPEVKATYTYMACATHPLSWLKDKPYTTIKTHCGFWTIESVPGSREPKEMEDMYGMRRRSSPKSYPVPKLEDLLERIRPDILVMQTGGNLFDLFPGKKDVRPDRDGAALRKFVVPFLLKAAGPSSSLRKIYWVGSPTTGRVSKNVQDFVIEQVRLHVGRMGSVIDSRSFVSYPYRHMEPDHEHFQGAEMDEWADKVFAVIKPDLSRTAVAAMKPLHDLALLVAAANQPPPPPEAPKDQALVLSGRLTFKSKPMRVEQLLPYQESLVGFVYDVRRVITGQYAERQVLVMHPAHIGLKKQALRKYRIGHSYKLHLRELEGTPWNTVKRKDDSGLIDLQPYIQLDDESRFPGANRPNSN
jgi:hypothetical protein